MLVFISVEGEVVDFKTKIKRLRESRGMTQDDLAKALGVTRPAVSQWESGWSHPRMGTIEKIAGYFGVTPAELISGSDSKEVVMTPDEENLLNMYRGASETDKATLLNVAHAIHSRQQEAEGASSRASEKTA